MSTLQVRVETVDEVLPHPNAERLSILVIGGHCTCAQKGLYAPDDAIAVALNARGDPGGRPVQKRGRGVGPGLSSCPVGVSAA